MKFISYVLLLVIVLITASFLFSGCNTYQKQLNKFNTFADANTAALAAKCVEHFPVKDSVGATHIDSSKKADNKNYQTSIDSLQQLADQLKAQIGKDTSSGNPCSSVAKSYQTQISGLNAKITDLKNAYKPCKPDTVFSTKEVFRKDEAALTVCANNYNKLRDSLLIVKANLVTEKETSSSRAGWIWKLGLALAAVAGVAVLKFIGKI